MQETILYHITRFKKLKKGDKLSFGRTLNFFAQRMLELEFKINEKDINELVFSKNFNEFTEEEIKTTKTYIYESCLMLRELILEQVRSQEFPHLPSRFKCIYCVKTLRQAQNWVSALKRMQPEKPPLQIVKLKCKGTAFEADGDLMLRNTLSINSKIEMAKKYWQGTTNSKHPEVLFVGEAEISEVIQEV